MEIQTSRFGSVDVSDEDLIRFENGIIGFPRECKFAMIPHAGSTAIAWLQSAETPELAFPVVSAHGLVLDYPDVPLTAAAEKAGIGGDPDELAVLAVLSAPTGQPATVNLLAPILIHSESRRAAQVFLEGSRFTTRELFITSPKPPEEASKAEEAAEETAEQAPEDTEEAQAV